MKLSERDYSETLTLEMEWREWTRIWTLCKQGMDKKELDDWPEEELEEDHEIVDSLCMKISDKSPGNGMEDWPDSMKEAYDETVMGMIEEL